MVLRLYCSILALLCANIGLLCVVLTAARSEKYITAVGTVAIMSAFGRPPPPDEKPLSSASTLDENPDDSWHVATTVRTDLVELRCPELRDPATGFLMPDPNCKVPLRRLMRGSEAVATFQRENKVLTGDKFKAVFDIVDKSTAKAPPSFNSTRRRLPATTVGIPQLRPGSFRLLERGDQKEMYTGAPIQLRAVVYLLDFCGWKNPFRSAEEFRKYIFNEPGSVEGNLQNYYQTCSFNKTLWDPSSVVVVGPFTVDCKGVYIRGIFSTAFDASTRCGPGEQASWVHAAESQAQKVATKGSVLEAVLQYPTRRRVLVVLPSEAKCGFSGLADVACSSATCRSYIKGTSAADVSVLFHELQHNIGLSHAHRGFEEYGDPADPMGRSMRSSQAVRCHNAPYSWRIGWATTVPNGNLSAGNFTLASNRIRLTIPSSGLTDANMVIVNLGRAANEAPSRSIQYFLSYRVRNSTLGAYDRGLSSSYSQKILIHTYDGTLSERDFNRSDFIDAGPRFLQKDPAFPARDVWTGPFTPFNSTSGLGGGLRVKVVSVGPSSAVVEVCRMYSQTEGKPGSVECDSNLDRDCDGLPAAVDPDCIGAWTALDSSMSQGPASPLPGAMDGRQAASSPPPARSPPSSSPPAPPSPARSTRSPSPRSPPPRLQSPPPRAVFLGRLGPTQMSSHPPAPPPSPSPQAMSLLLSHPSSMPPSPIPQPSPSRTQPSSLPPPPRPMLPASLPRPQRLPLSPTPPSPPLPLPHQLHPP
ncbi:hypothetical protein Vafri_12193 [Volvox africanus]|uniref:Peptidase M11 gametolysin domain-containing protein n=1 Tax=Volvox africanus TaxID=51714 RepID=A0A8J4B9I1_9CHLO|nr:hypothetical protein Vafri_12193 [Volvox africanus]